MECDYCTCAHSDDDAEMMHHAALPLSSKTSLSRKLKPPFPVFLGVDPKSVLCAFFKQGQCTKGDKCKFSHDLTLERKCEKRSVYIDGRDEELEKGTRHFLAWPLTFRKGALWHLGCRVGGAVAWTL